MEMSTHYEHDPTDYVETDPPEAFDADDRVVPDDEDAYPFDIYEGVCD